SRRLVPGKPLAVAVTASDPETKVDRVWVYQGTPAADGKFPESAPRAEAVLSPIGWVAELALTGDLPAGRIRLTAVAENEVGLRTAKSGEVDISYQPTGALAATVERGGRALAGAEVTVRD